MRREPRQRRSRRERGSRRQPEVDDTDDGSVEGPSDPPPRRRHSPTILDAGAPDSDDAEPRDPYGTRATDHANALDREDTRLSDVYSTRATDHASALDRDDTEPSGPYGTRATDHANALDPEGARTSDAYSARATDHASALDPEGARTSDAYSTQRTGGTAPGDWRERLAQRRESTGEVPVVRRPPEARRKADARRRPAKAGRGSGGLAVCIGSVLVMALVGAGAITLWSRVADARSADAAERDGDARSLRGAPLPDPTAAVPAGPGHVLVAGDSLTATATYIYGPGEGAPPDVRFVAWQGWTAIEAQPAVDAAVAEGRADTVIVALGTNDSGYAWGGDGWTAADVERFRELLATPADSSCVVVVLPGYGQGIDPRHAAEMDRARTDLARLADDRHQHREADPQFGPTVVVDWHAEVTARPELLSPDGIHLAQDGATGFISTEAAAARTTMYWDAVAACDDQ